VVQSWLRQSSSRRPSPSSQDGCHGNGPAVSVMTTIDLSVVPGFVLAVILILIAPGPDLAYMVAVGLGSGRRAALSAIAGICSGMGIYALIVIAGLGTIVASSPLALTVIKIFGAGYLLWLGIGAIRSPRTAAGNQRSLDVVVGTFGVCWSVSRTRNCFSSSSPCYHSSSEKRRARLCS
jgi:hypothetical protein